jgi:DNA segregation ATPase FtsK/SpoIIIE, S-DNA-T family
LNNGKGFYLGTASSSAAQLAVVWPCNARARGVQNATSLHKPTAAPSDRPHARTPRDPTASKTPRADRAVSPVGLGQHQHATQRAHARVPDLARLCRPRPVAEVVPATAGTAPRPLAHLLGHLRQPPPTVASDLKAQCRARHLPSAPDIFPCSLFVRISPSHRALLVAGQLQSVSGPAAAPTSTAPSFCPSPTPQLAPGPTAAPLSPVFPSAPCATGNASPWAASPGRHLLQHPVDVKLLTDQVTGVPRHSTGLPP